jgi:hypothetical protein
MIRFIRNRRLRHPASFFQGRPNVQSFCFSSFTASFQPIQMNQPFWQTDKLDLMDWWIGLVD